MARVRLGCTSLKSITENLGYSAIPDSEVDGIGCGITQIGIENAATPSVPQFVRESMNARGRVTMPPFFVGRVDT